MRHSVLVVVAGLAGQVFRQLVVSGADFLSLTLESPHIEKSTKILHGDD